MIITALEKRVIPDMLRGRFSVLSRQNRGHAAEEVEHIGALER